MVTSSRHLSGAVTCSVALLILASSALAQPMIYPSKGQSVQKQQRDQYDCYQWAKGQTGVEPSRAAPQTASAPAPRGGAVRGAAGGAALGAIGGAIGGNAGKGAAIGAGVGAAAGLFRQRRARRSQQQAQQQASASQQQNLAQYNRAFAACMQGRGYVVK